MSRLEQRLRCRGENNLDFLRFVAALLVILNHSIALLGYRRDPLASLTGCCTLGQLGVALFFCMSGLLVTRSWLDEPRPGAFALKRILRLLPGLWLAILLGAFVVGPLLSRLPHAAYFSDPDTWDYLRGLAVFPVRYSLPGVFLDNPTHAFNGSLWTLSYELYGCFAVLAAGWLGCLTPRRFPWVAAVVVAGWVCLCLSGQAEITSEPDSVHLFAGDECSLFFLLGAAWYVYRDFLPLDGRLALAALALWLGTLSTGWLGYAVSVVVLPYLLFYAAFVPVPGLGHWARYGDLSYGLYIYAFPIQQTLVWWLGYRRLSVTALAALSLAAVLPTAWVSWHLVEKPALELARRWRRSRPAPGSQAAAPLAEPAGA